VSGCGSAAILPPGCRRSPKVGEVPPLLYLLGLSNKNFLPALDELFGSRAGLSAPVVTRLTVAGAPTIPSGNKMRRNSEPPGGR
jgi:hypothetical protein